jgi:hypothetical protein
MYINGLKTIMKLLEILQEGGEMLSTDGVDRIKKEDIVPTLDMISAMSGLPLKFLKDKRLQLLYEGKFDEAINLTIDIP